MPGSSSSATERSPEPPEIDTTKAHPARVYDYLLGGVTNFAADVAAAQRQGEAMGGIDNARAAVRANRVFLERAVGWLAAEASVGQFLDIGSGIPAGDNVHEVAQRVASDARVVYVDNDPVVLAHAHQLLQSEGTTAYIQADLADPTAILEQAAETLDLSRPIAVVLVAILHFEHPFDAYGVVSQLVDAVASGSYLVISHLTADFRPEVAQMVNATGDQATYRFLPRTRAEVLGFFDGLELVEPGLVARNQWRPEGEISGWGDTGYAGVALKP